VRILPQQPGQKERRYVQLLTGEPTAEMLSATPIPVASADAGPSRQARVEALEAELAALRNELRDLREQFETFRKQFES
jgi:hypothetical protein